MRLFRRLARFTNLTDACFTDGTSATPKLRNCEISQMTKSEASRLSPSCRRDSAKCTRFLVERGDCVKYISLTYFVQ
jgi:hypothetical protein